MSEKEFVLKGIPAAPGIAMGPAYILDRQEIQVPPRSIREEEVPIEIARFEEALIKTRTEIAELKRKIGREMGVNQAKIFDAHLMVLEDASLNEEVIKRIRQEKQSAEAVFAKVLKKYVKAFSKIPDDYLRERTADIADIGRRVLKNLMDEDQMMELDQLKGELVVVAHDLSPSNTAGMYNKEVLAFATDVGGRTSHTAIMAKTLGIPAVVGLKDATLRIHNQDMVIVDGRMGLVIVHPSEKTLSIYREEKARVEKMRHRFDEIKNLPAQTPDGREVHLLANIELPEEVPLVIDRRAEGIGLYRTEYFYMNRVDLPSEDEQYAAYRSVVEAISPRPVTIRTLDLGGDKFLSSLQIPREMYPYLGWRAVKFCLARPDIFKTQLRAILRASAHGAVRLMFPMISGPEEMKQALDVLNDVKKSLGQDGIAFVEDIPIGAMIEVPSAVMTADMLARQVKFFSIGTNDLIQYSLAVDRVNEHTAAFYDPCHPAILRSVDQVVRAGHEAGISVSLCGEMGSEPSLAVLLLGLGVDELSMSPLDILPVKKMIRSIRHEEAQDLARRCLSMESSGEIESCVKTFLKERVPEVTAQEERVEE